MRKKICLIGITMLFISGCVSVGHKVNLDNSRKIVKGTTTKAEIIAIFGQPNTTTYAQERYVYMYFGYQMNNTAWNFIPVVNIVHSKMDTKNQVLTITFNNKDIVEDYNFTTSNTPVTSGILP